MSVVLDSWAVIAYLDGLAPTAGLVEELLAGAESRYMSWMNVGEVHYIDVRRHGGDVATSTTRDLSHLITCLVPDEALILAAARIKADRPMAYADAFAAATAVATGAILWTGDPELLVPGAPWQWRDLRP